MTDYLDDDVNRRMFSSRLTKQNRCICSHRTFRQELVEYPDRHITAASNEGNTGQSNHPKRLYFLVLVSYRIKCFFTYCLGVMPMRRLNTRMK